MRPLPLSLPPPHRNHNSLITSSTTITPQDRLCLTDILIQPCGSVHTSLQGPPTPSSPLPLPRPLLSRSLLHILCSVVTFPPVCLLFCLGRPSSPGEWGCTVPPLPSALHQQAPEMHLFAHHRMKGQRSKGTARGGRAKGPEHGAGGSVAPQHLPVLCAGHPQQGAPSAWGGEPEWATLPWSEKQV